MSHARHASRPPRRLDAILPWMVSLTFHLAVGLIACFAYFLTMSALSTSDARAIIVPNSFQDPSFSEHPGTAAPGGGGDPLRQAAQDRLKELARAEGWGSGGTQNVSSLLGGQTDAVGIFAGSGATVAPGATGSAAAAYGTPGGGAVTGPRSSFYGMGGNAVKVVYLIDRTGSLDSFGAGGTIEPGTVKYSVQESVNNLSPLQYFAVLVFTGDADGGTQIIGSTDLVQALPEKKAAVLGALRKVVAQGGLNDEETIFLVAFRKALALNPELIFFLTDGQVSPAVVAEVKKLNTQHAVINSVMFTTNTVENMGLVEKRRYDVMTDLAQQNRGIVKVVSVSLPQ